MAKLSSRFSGSLPELETMRALRTCPVCGVAYKRDTVHVIETRDSARLLHVSCAACSHALLTIITTTDFGMSAVGMMTDLSAADAHRLRDRRAITDEDIFALHTKLSYASSAFESAIAAWTSEQRA